MAPTAVEAENDSEPIRQRLVRGVAWTAAGKLSTQLVTGSSVVWLARLLSPADFGIVAMARAFLGVSNALAEFGLSNAIMNLRDIEGRTLAQLNTAALVLCALIFGVCVVAAPLIGGFFGAEGLTDLVRVNSVALLLSGVQIIPIGLLKRRQDYKRLAVLEGTQVTLRAILVTAFALAGWGYWSIVAGGLVARGAAVGMAWNWARVGAAVPRWADIRRPVMFGGQVTIAGVSGTIVSQADAAVIGRMLGDSLLGAYRMAIDLARMPSERVSELVLRVTGPHFAAINTSKTLTREYYTKILEVLLVLSAPLSFGLALVAEEVVVVVLSEQWRPAIAPLRALALLGTLAAAGSLTSQVLVSQGHTRFVMNLSIVKSLILAAAFVAGARWGIQGVAIAWIFVEPVAVLINILVLRHVVGLEIRELLRVSAPAGVPTLVIGVAATRGKGGLPGAAPSPLLQLAGLIALGGVTYVFVMVTLFSARTRRYVAVLRRS